MAIIVIAQGELEVGGEIFLTCIFDSVADRHGKHAAVVGVDSGVESHGNNLQVISRIEEYLCSVAVVSGIEVDDRCIGSDDHDDILRVDNTKR